MLLLALPSTQAAAAPHTATPTQDNVRYVGSVTCQSSMCHGGASPSRNQFTIWSRDDFHSRAYATLTTARSTRIAEGAGIANATQDARCTVCHAPLACARDVAKTAVPAEGVSCENCHGAASFWLRGHTRTDWTYQDRIHAGMVDLRNVYVRADTCVKCHQVIEPALLKAGHPELTFELDGQTASEPRHWKEKADWFGPKAWLVGQAVALREISLQLSKAGTDDSHLMAQQQALVWLMGRLRTVHEISGWMGSRVDSASAPGSRAPSPEEIALWGNALAQQFSAQPWSPALTSENLTSLAGTAPDFTDGHETRDEQQRRAERLVLGLDRLFKSLHGDKSAPGSTELAALFAAVQDRERFDPQAFGAQLQKFAAAIK